MFRIESRSAVPVYEQLKRQIRLAIVTGQLLQGDRLSSIRDLSISLRINPNTVAKAYRQLESEGFLELRAGSGAFVRINDELLRSDRKKLMEILVEEYISGMTALGATPKELVGLIGMKVDGEVYDDSGE